MFTGQCVTTDKKFITVDALRRLIARDCPIKNGGPCPKRPVTATVTAEPVICPAAQSCECPSILPYQCPQVEPAMLDCPKVIPICNCSTTVTSSSKTGKSARSLVECQEDLEKCQRSLLFSGVSKSGAQDSRKTWREEATRLGEVLFNLNLTKIQFQNKSIALVEEVRRCQERNEKIEQDVEDLTHGWGSANATIRHFQIEAANLTKLWEDCLQDQVERERLMDDQRTNITVCRGELVGLQETIRTCQTDVGELRRNGSGNS